MAEEITYYAIVNEFSSRERPGGVLRRIRNEAGRLDEAFTRDLEWSGGVSARLPGSGAGNADGPCRPGPPRVFWQVGQVAADLWMRQARTGAWPGSKSSMSSKVVAR
jgi:hypothetical protein